MRRASTPLLLLCALGSVAVYAQEAIQVTPKMIQEHIDHRVFPVYPPSAKAAHIEGPVFFKVRIGTTGKIESMEVVAGDPMLQQAAIDALKQCTFHPFEKDGVPVIATGQYEIFVLNDQSDATESREARTGSPPKTLTVRVRGEESASGPDEELNNKFDDALEACKKGIMSRQMNDAVASLCKNSAMLAEKLPTDWNYLPKRSAYDAAASAYSAIRDYKDALPWAEKAVEVVKLGHDHDFGSSEAYYVRGAVEAYLHDFPSAEYDLTIAEDFGRKAITRTVNEGPGLHAEHVRFLVGDLRFHAKVLQALGRTDEAQKKLDEAAKYDSSNK
jgi:TonB family protein